MIVKIKSNNVYEVSSLHGGGGLRCGFLGCDVT